MTQPTYAITGIPIQPGQESHPPPRKEVTSWFNSPANARQVSLFIRALTEFQHLSPTQDALSYYRIAGIHGNPDVEWDGVGNPPGTVGRPSWWCAHNKETFVSWHRPFLVLFEQRIHEIMQGIIDKNIPADRQGPWSDAARDWRQPYWDWGLKQPYIDGLGMPEIFTKDRLDILDLADNSPPTMENIANPLAKFANPTGVAMGDTSMGKFALTEDPWSKAIATSRRGINRADAATSWANGVNNWEKANQAMAAGNQAGSIPDQIYRLFATDLSSWESFASTRSQPPPMPSDFMSLEAIHNAIHGYVGGRDTLVGHMGDPSVAAFDPIFWFHHCNVDHLAATFQTLHPDMWYDPVTEFAATKLDPFHRDTANTSWTADDTRDWKANLRYTYDDLEDLRPRQSLATFHGFVARALGRSHAHAGGEGGGLATLRKRINDKYGAVCREIRDSTGIQGKGNDYVINITYDRYALQGTPYHIHFFLGTPPPAEGDDSFSHAEETYIGNVYTFSSNLEPDANGSQCHNCLEQKSAGVLSTAQIPLTSAILKAAKQPDKTGLHSILPEEVESYLASYLTWRATAAAGESNESPPQTTIVDMSRLPKTKISVMKGNVHYPDSDAELTTYGDYIPLWRATSGKAGGAVQAPPNV
ncbi:common central domain of tyrosinase-domain-containing protein [Aspergillus pseudoustus]|uniref:tyrosinase n=1 Tax=Aspergillus pseudoustus TaxID=1810923 RepID=A0ABR4K0T4_9EURO